MDFIFTDGGRAAAGYKGTAGDCFARAVAVVTGKPYAEVYGLVNKHCHKGSARTGVWTEEAKKVMAELGWRWIPTMAVGKGCTTHLSAEELPKGRVICRVSKHYVAVIDGVIHDTHNPSRGGTRCVYGYWKKV
jgi:hypothetical protein